MVINNISLNNKNYFGKNMQIVSEKSSFLERNLQFSVLQLTSWPPLSDLLLESAPDVTRICALLARKPSVGMLIPVILNIPPQVIYSLLDTLYTKGHISSVGSGLVAESASLCKIDSTQSLELPMVTASFLDKIWHRLMDRK